jgi:hypothetical protein
MSTIYFFFALLVVSIIPLIRALSISKRRKKIVESIADFEKARR